MLPAVAYEELMTVKEKAIWEEFFSVKKIYDKELSEFSSFKEKYKYFEPKNSEELKQQARVLLEKKGYIVDSPFEGDFERWIGVYARPKDKPTYLDPTDGEEVGLQEVYSVDGFKQDFAPENIQELYLESLKLLGIDPLEHDIRFVEDNWENPSMGCAGLGWEVWLDGMEITQFTYFQQVGGLQCHPVTSEITYGLERLASYIQEVESVYDLEWTQGVKYGEIFVQPEYEHSKYSFEISNQEMLLENFDKFEKEAKRCIEESLVHPAYDYILKCSHTFNLLDARGAVSVTERAGYLARIRNMARSVAKIFVAEREKLGFPLLNKDQSVSKEAE